MGSGVQMAGAAKRSAELGGRRNRISAMAVDGAIYVGTI